MQSDSGEEAGDVTASTATETDTGDGTTSSGECTEDGLDPGCPVDAPYCVMGSCVSCTPSSGATSCQELEPDKPLCHQVAGICVTCLPDQTDHCPHTEPFCDNSFACSGCTEHSQCPDSACDIEHGTCFATSRVFWVDNGNPDCPGAGTQANPYCTIKSALDEIVVPGSAEHELHSEGVVNVVRTATPYTENVALATGEGKRIALIGVGSPAPMIRDQTHAVNGGRHSIYVSNMSLSHNLESGLRSSIRGRIWVDDTVITGNAVGVIVTNGGRVRMRRVRILGNEGHGVDMTDEGRLYLESSIVGNNGDALEQTAALHADTGSSFEVVYSTLASNSGALASSVRCLAEAGGSVRNSIVLGATLDTIDCASATFHHSFVDTQIEGEGVVVASEYDEGWFVNVGNGIFRPTSGSPFRDVAAWELGDPLHDLAGAVRPWVPGNPDVAGALLP